jgi:hypothetical protein
MRLNAPAATATSSLPTPSPCSMKPLPAACATSIVSPPPPCAKLPVERDVVARLVNADQIAGAARWPPQPTTSPMRPHLPILDALRDFLDHAFALLVIQHPEIAGIDGLAGLSPQNWGCRHLASAMRDLQRWDPGPIRLIHPPWVAHFAGRSTNSRPPPATDSFLVPQESHTTPSDPLRAGPCA